MFELFPDENGAKLTSVGAGQHLPSSFGRGCLVPSFVAELEARAAAAPLLYRQKSRSILRTFSQDILLLASGR